MYTICSSAQTNSSSAQTNRIAPKKKTHTHTHTSCKPERASYTTLLTIPVSLPTEPQRRKQNTTLTHSRIFFTTDGKGAVTQKITPLCMSHASRYPRSRSSAYRTARHDREKTTPPPPRKPAGKEGGGGGGGSRVSLKILARPARKKMLKTYDDYCIDRKKQKAARVAWVWYGYFLCPNCAVRSSTSRTLHGDIVRVPRTRSCGRFGIHLGALFCRFIVEKYL